MFSHIPLPLCGCGRYTATEDYFIKTISLVPLIQKSYMIPVSTIYNLFSSTRLTILLLSCLIFAAMAGTILPQFSEGFTYNIYHSWWFFFLFGLLSSNIIICSIERWPAIWKQIRPEPAAISISRVQKWPRQTKWEVTKPLDSYLANLTVRLKTSGWQIQQQHCKEYPLLVFQKGKYTRLGTLLVHGSILLILAGGAIGKIYGFKTYVTLTETEQVSKLSSKDKTQHFDLGFTVRCESFSIDRYPSGSIKNYGSRLSFIENNEVLITRDIHVNTPVTYKGITFYQSDFEAYNNFIFSITNKETESNTTLTASFQQQVEWRDKGIRLGVINAELDDESVTRLKLWITDTVTAPVQFWMPDNSTTSFDTEQGQYDIHVKQLYSTGLQVSKDPGIFLVYTGFALLLSGLLCSFFMSHRRIVLYFVKEDTASYIYFFGSSNKQHEAFLKNFNTLADILKKETLH